MEKKSSLVAKIAGVGVDWILPAFTVSLIFVMLVPLPSMLLDVLLTLSITISVLVLLAALQILKPVQFSVFPSLLLLLTLLRLSLDLACSRRILLHGNEGASAAGQVIEAFGQFVVGGNYVVGFVLFLALIAIQYMVVSHGAVRTAEVTARFTLDAMPGKQMAIDADLNAGLIDEAQARSRREQIAREAEFYGAMDGAARFNQRDSLATILITGINIVAGLLIGTLQQGIDLGEAVRTYTILTVGDGLVTMIPSLLVSVAGGMVLTRASSAGQLTAELGTQLLGKGTTLYVASGVLGALCLIPGLPKLAFLVPALALGYAGTRVARREAPPSESEAAKKTAEKPESLAPVLRLDDLSLEIGFQLIPLVDEKQGGQMLGRVKTLRRHLAQELGFLIPPVHISDNLRLKAREYVISLRGIEIGRWQTESNCLLAVSTEPHPRPLAGKETREPAYGAPARWIQPSAEEEALAAGYSVVDQGTLIGTHLAELIRRHAHELLGRAETKRLLDSLAESHPKLVEELVPKVLSLGEVQKVLQQLLRERVSIRDLGTILEALVESSPQNRGLAQLVEAARQALGRRVTQGLVDADGTLRVIALEPALEEELMGLVSSDPSVRQLAGGPAIPILKRIADSLKNLMGSVSSQAQPVLLCASPARYHLRRWLEPALPGISVIAPVEIPPGVPVRAVGLVRQSG